MVGRTVGHYVLREKIGEGGMGAVYRAEHTRIRHSVAVKVLRPEYHQDPQIIARFFNEAKAAHDIGHEHIVEIFDFGEMEDGTSCIIMEWLSGRSLAALLRAEPLLPLRRTLRIITEVGEALAAAHAHGVIHRDLKPDNIFLVDRGEDHDFVKVLDFGLAKLLKPSEMQAFLRTNPNAFLGTPAYMSPEQCRGAHQLVDQRSDVYALGVILYEMVVGRRPFMAKDLPGIVLAHIGEAPPAPRSLQPLLPPAVESVLLCALAKPPELRYQTMEEFLCALSEVAGTDFTPAPVVTSGKAGDGAGSAAGRCLLSAVSSTGSRAHSGSSEDPTVVEIPLAQPAGVRSEVGTLTVAEAEAVSVPSRRTRRGLLFGSCVLMMGFAGFLMLRQVVRAAASTSSLAAASSAPLSGDAAPSAGGAAAVHVAIRTVPPEAELTLDGTGLENPFTGDLARTEMRRLLVAQAQGYRMESRWVVFDHDQEMTLRLKRTEGQSPAPAASPNKHGRRPR
jgi:hypothetical protein